MNMHVDILVIINTIDLLSSLVSFSPLLVDIKIRLLDDVRGLAFL